MFGLSPWELLIVFMVILLLFGARRLPEIGSSLGKGIREFKDSIKEVEGEVKGEIGAPPTSAPPPKQEENAAPRSEAEAQ